MRRARILLILVPFALGFGSYAAVNAVTSRNAPPACSMTGIGMLNDYLSLTPSQRQKVSVSTATAAKVRNDLREEVWKSRNELVKVLADPESTSKDGVAAVRRFGKAQQAMQENTIRYVYELRKHLDDGQKARLARLLDRGMCGIGCGAGSGAGTGRGRGQCGLGMGFGACGGGRVRR
jgi:Spy/CpxP family protein refolding chaperone